LSDEAEVPSRPEAPPSTRRGRVTRWLAIAIAGVLALLVAAAMAVRIAVLTPAGRAFVVAHLEGLALGPVGRLHIEGLSGDVLGDFRLAHLAIVDPRGRWLDARGVHVVWDWKALLTRQVRINALSVDRVQVARQPVLTPSKPGPPGPMPVSIALERADMTLETLPAISMKRGLFQVAARLLITRRGALAGEVHGRSLLHAGDGLDTRFNFAVHNQLLFDAHIREADGGAIAGLAGLAADRPFVLDAHASGAPRQGVLHLRAYSGAEEIALVDGGWTPQGGAGTGRVSLAASRWTSGWMHQFGPQVRLAGHGRGLGHDRYDLALEAASDNAVLAASGVVDAGAQAVPAGLKIQARVNDLSRIVSTPAMGRGVLDGVLAGRAADWRLAGPISVERLGYAGYTLGRVSGTAELAHAKGEWRLKTNLSGAGGQGQGLLAALAGPSPRAALEGSRLPDGRYLLKSLDATGAGLRLQASGGRALLGALNFKGQADFSNLRAVHPGARGTLTAHWSASQSRPGGGWSLNADAAGAGFATGLGEVDRLLGARPTLALAGSYDAGALGLTRASLTGAAARFTGAGRIGKDGALKLSLDWSASGPFEAGPVEIAGEAKGAASLMGTLAQPRADLLADFDRIDLPNLALKPAHVVLTLARTQSGVDGLVNIAANSDYGLAHAKAGLHFLGDGLGLTDIDAAAGGATVEGALALHGAAPSSADLTLTLGPGAFASKGRAQARLMLRGQPGAANADIQLTADDLVLRGSTTMISKARFSASGPLAHLPYALSAVAADEVWPVKLDGSGVVSQTAQGYDASFSGSGKVRGADFKTRAPAALSLAGARRSARLDVAVGGGEAQVAAGQTGDGIDAKARLTDVDLATFGQDIAGRVSASLDLAGQGPALSGSMDAALSGARSRDAPAKLGLGGRIHATLTSSRIDVEAHAAGSGTGDHASLRLVLPAEASAAPFRIAVARTQPISGQFDINGELAPIWDLYFGGDQTLSGALSARGGVGGTLDAPRLTGHASLAQGRFEDAASGLKLRNLTADVALSETHVAVENFSGVDAKSGTVSGSGQFSLAPAGESTLTLNVKNFQLLDNEDAKASATGAVTVTRAATGKLQLAGMLTIDQANISAATRTPPGVVSMDVVERNLPIGEGGQLRTAPSGKGPEIGLDIRLKAPRHVLVRGLGLNVELSLDAQVGGTLADPRLSGIARVVRGDYNFAGKRFEIDDSGTVSLATSPEQIRLDLSAEWQAPSLTAVIRIRGTAAHPVISLTSTPVLPQDEILSQVLFGSSASQLSPVEAAQLAAAVTTFATGGGFDVMGGLSRFARLDRLALGGTEASGVTVSGGKYIGNHLYLELTGGGRYGPSAQVEFRASRAFSIISSVGGEAGAKLAVRWRRDYGRAPQVGRPAKAGASP
jgi:translocation and assembly module TamB